LRIRTKKVRLDETKMSRPRQFQLPDAVQTVSIRRRPRCRDCNTVSYTIVVATVRHTSVTRKALSHGDVPSVSVSKPVVAWSNARRRCQHQVLLVATVLQRSGFLAISYALPASSVHNKPRSQGIKGPPTDRSPGTECRLRNMPVKIQCAI